MRDERVKEITTAGIFAGIILFMSLVPAPWGLTWGFIRTAGGIEFTIIHIPVIIGSIFGGKRVAITLGFTFGIGSLLAALIYGGPFAIFFLNPIVSVLPRILFGYFIYLIYVNINKLVKQPVLSMALSFGLSTLAHSIMVVTVLYLFSFHTDVYLEYYPNTNILQFLIALIGFNALIEIGIAIFIGTPIGMRIKEFKDFEQN